MAFTPGALQVEILPPSDDKKWWQRILFGRKRRKLIRELAFTCYIGHSKLEIIVPKDYITDFGTIPRLFWVILPPDHHHYIRSTIIHDYCLTDRNDIDRIDCHNILDKAMKAEKCPRWKRRLMVWAVRRWNS